MNSKKILIYTILVLISLLSVNAETMLDECKGTIDIEESPCLVLLPVTTGCGPISISFFNNASTFLYSQSMDQFNAFTCNATFNQTELGTYTFNYTTGDSGSIIVEEGNVNFFNITVFGVFMIIILTFVTFMHKFKDDDIATAVVYGWMATGISVILMAIILSPQFELIKGVILLINTDIYVALVIASLAFYTALASNNLRKSIPRAEEF